MTPQYTGHLSRDGDTWRGEIVDAWGWKIQLTGAVKLVDGRNVLLLQGTIGEVPAALRVPIADDPDGVDLAG